MIPLNPDEISFPDPELTETDTGLIAYGGDLSPQRLLFGYQLGIFPWFNEGDEILWWCPDPRFVLYPDNIKISNSMRKILRDNIFSFTENHSFEEVIRACRHTERPGQDGTWLTDELIESLLILNSLGVAKSYEAWKDGKLAGGFYGVWVGKVFCGESMFSKESNASKAAFINFVQTQKDRLELIDCQIHSDHLESLGAEMITKKEYLQTLKKYYES